jgi:hypothetical protein
MHNRLQRLLLLILERDSRDGSGLVKDENNLQRERDIVSFYMNETHHDKSLPSLRNSKMTFLLSMDPHRVVRTWTGIYVEMPDLSVSPYGVFSQMSITLLQAV